MMKQYLSIRQNEQYTGCIVFFQMGEFYECFFEDAEVASRALGISLTARGKHLGMPIPMAGVPLHAGASFIARMVRAGYKVVVVDQLETPLAARSRGPSALVKRQVTRIVTPGTVTEEALLSPGEANHLAAVSVAADGQHAAVAWCDVSTGAFHVQPCAVEEVPDALNAVAAREVLLPHAAAPAAGAALDAALHKLHRVLGVRAMQEGGDPHPTADGGEADFGSPAVYRHTCNDCSCVTLYDPSAELSEGWADESLGLSDVESAAAKAATQYVEWALQGAHSALRAPIRVGIAAHSVPSDTGESISPASGAAGGGSEGGLRQNLPVMAMDHWTRRGLELHRPLHGRHRGRGSLLAVVDFTSSSAGSRLLDARLAAPLAHADGVRHRLAAVRWLKQRGFFNRQLRRALGQCGDMERAQQRVTLAASRGIVASDSGAECGAEVEQPETEPSKIARRRAGRTVRSNAGAAVPLGELGAPGAASTPREADLLCIRDGLGVALQIGRALQTALRADIPEEFGHPGLSAILHASQIDFDVASALGSSDPQGRDSEVLRLCAGALLLHAETHTAALLPALEATYLELCAALVGEAPPVDVRPPGQEMSLTDGEEGKAGESSDARPPQPSGAGSAIRAGYNAQLDDLRQLRDNSTAAVADLQNVYRAQLGISTLKIKHTSEQGFTIEVPSKAADSVPVLPKGSSAPADAQAADAWVWSRTLKNTVRFKNKHLGALDRQLADAATKAAALERTILRDLASRLASVAAGVHAVARATAVLDVTASCAHAADVLRLTEPEVTNGLQSQPPCMELLGSRHLVVEQGLLGAWAWRYADGAAARSAGMLMDKHAHSAAGESNGQVSELPLPIASTDPMSRAFVPNDAVLGSSPSNPHCHETEAAGRETCLLITGPNMGGKSTFLRQVAQAAILAQMGSFVPAEQARVSIVDAVFARVGASDDVSRDRSTFMCEMSETAAILNKATQHSLVVVDEIGRGTAAADGLAIAWAVLQELAQGKQCRTLFATHFHELAEASRRAPCRSHVACHTAEVHMTSLGPVLTHRIVPGASNASYGIHVARQAGVPDAVLQVATDTLHRLQAEGSATDAGGGSDWWSVR